MTRAWSNLIIVLAWLAFAALLASGLKSFSIWEQVLDIHAQGQTLAELYDARHPHFLRYVVAFPIFWLSDASGLSDDVVFNAVCLALLPTLIVLLRSIMTNSRSDAPSAVRVAAIALLVFFVAYYMNGRGLFSLVGYAMILLALKRLFVSRTWSVTSFLLCLLGTLLCSVSSGVFAVAFAFMALAALFAMFGPFAITTRSRILTAVCVLVIFGLFQEFLFIGIVKNLDFYGGGLDATWDMLQHGPGRFLALINPELLLLTIPMIAMTIYILMLLIRRLSATDAVAVLGLITAVAGGMYGLSTLSVALVPLLAIHYQTIAHAIGTTIAAPTVST